MSSDSDTFSLFGLRYLRGGSRAPVLPYLIAAGDQLLRLLVSHAERDSAPPSLDGGLVAVAKIDHLGDLLMATGVLAELQRQAPGTRVALIVGSWCSELAERLRIAGLCHAVIHYDHWALNRKVTRFRALEQFIRSNREAIHKLSSLRPRAFLDLRTRSPSGLWLAERARVPYRIGFGLRGLSYTLNGQIPFCPERSLGQLYMDALPLLGLAPASYLGPILDGPSGTVASPTHRRLPDPYVVAHFASGASARNAADGDWRQLLASIPKAVTVVAVGTRQDRDRFSHLAAAVGESRWVNLMGETSIAELAAIVRDSSGGVAVDSFVAHLLVAYRRPAVVLMRRGVSQRQSFPDHAPGVRFEALPLESSAIAFEI